MLARPPVESSSVFCVAPRCNETTVPSMDRGERFEPVVPVARDDDDDDVDDSDVDDEEEEDDGDGEGDGVARLCFAVDTLIV